VAFEDKAGVNARWLLTGNGPRFRSEILDKNIVDKVFVRLLHEVLRHCIKDEASPLTKPEKVRLLQYLASDRSLGLREAIQTLFDLGAVEHFDELTEWGEAIHDMISASAADPAPAPRKVARKRRKPGRAGPTR